jgi:uncharacterized membrane protein
VLEQCERSDRVLAWASLAFLFFVTTLPFTASALAGHVHLRLAVLVYWANLAALGATLAWVVTHVGRRLAGPDREFALTLIRRRLILAQSLYALAALGMLIDPVASIVALAVVQLFFVVSPRIPFRV